MPPNSVRVTRPSRWGNPFKVGRDGTAEECLRKYTRWLLPYTHESGTMQEFFQSELTLEEIQRELGGKDLACFCPVDAPLCHADILLKLANG